MSFSLMEAFVEIKADDRKLVRGVARARGLVNSLPSAKSVVVSADVGGVVRGFRRAQDAAGGYQRAVDAGGRSQAGYWLAEAKKAVQVYELAERGRRAAVEGYKVASAAAPAAGYAVKGGVAHAETEYGLAAAGGRSRGFGFGHAVRPESDGAGGYAVRGGSAGSTYGFAPAAREKLDAPGGKAAVADAMTGRRPAAPALDNAGFAAGLARAKSHLDSLPARKAVRLDLQTSGFTAGLAKARGVLDASLASMKASLASMASYALPALAVQGAVSAFTAAIHGASSLAETMSKVDVVFGGSAAKVKALGDQMAETYGSGRGELLDAAAGFGLIGKAAGLAQAEAGDLAVSLAKLADDATSFYDVPLEEALRTLKSALVGEAEPIRRFGVLLNEDAVKSEAFRMGIARVGKELTEGQKVLARYSLIQKGMTDATGDHARTADSFANQLREVQGRLYDLGVTAGGVVLPALNVFLESTNHMVAALGYVGDKVKKVTELFGWYADAAKKAAGAGDKAPGKPWLGGGLYQGPNGIAAAGAGAAEGGEAGSKYGMAAAREAVKTDALNDEQKKLEARAKLQADAAAKQRMIDRMNADHYKRTWIAAEAERIKGMGGMTSAIPGNAEAHAEHNFEEKRQARGGDFKVTGDPTKASRDLIDKAMSLGKEKLGQAMDFRETIRRQALNVAGRGADALLASGAQKNKDKERAAEREGDNRFGYSAGGQDLRNQLQESVGRLNVKTKDDKKEDKEIAKNTADTVTALTVGLGNLVRTMKDLRVAATYQ